MANHGRHVGKGGNLVMNTLGAISDAFSVIADRWNIRLGHLYDCCTSTGLLNIFESLFANVSVVVSQERPIFPRFMQTSGDFSYLPPDCLALLLVGGVCGCMFEFQLL